MARFILLLSVSFFIWLRGIFIATQGVGAQASPVVADGLSSCGPGAYLIAPLEEEKLKFYITSFSFCLCNSASPLQNLDHISHVVSESGDLQYWELEFISLTLVLLFAITQSLQTCLIMPVHARHPPPTTVLARVRNPLV